MKDFSYFIPGYTGFCPELREHFGETYGHATRCILQKAPHLKERLAPVHYKHRRFERTKSTLAKYLNQERDKLDYLKSNHLDICEKKHQTSCNIGDTVNELCHLHYKDDDVHQRTFSGDCEGICPAREKYVSTYADGDNIRKVEEDSVYPKYVCIRGFAECIRPIRTSGGRIKPSQEYYSRVLIPCAHMIECHEHYIPDEKHQVPMSTLLKKEYHPADCGHGKDAKLCNNRKMRKGQVKLHRHGGVIPKYTGHIQGMQFSFGESYGPVSDRLLRKHHDRMKELKIKS